jgi:hypothetical protein
VSKNRILLGLALAAIILIGLALYRSYFSSDRLNVEPHAAEEIDKAKRR